MNSMSGFGCPVLNGDQVLNPVTVYSAHTGMFGC